MSDPLPKVTCPNGCNSGFNMIDGDYVDCCKCGATPIVTPAELRKARGLEESPVCFCETASFGGPDPRCPACYPKPQTIKEGEEPCATQLNAHADRASSECMGSTKNAAQPVASNAAPTSNPEERPHPKSRMREEQDHYHVSFGNWTCVDIFKSGNVVAAYRDGDMDYVCDLGSITLSELASLREEVARLAKKQEGRNGVWFDQWGACKICDGEIPDGHLENCDLWKLEQKHDKLRVELSNSDRLHLACEEAYRKEWVSQIDKLRAENEELRESLCVNSAMAAQDEEAFEALRLENARLSQTVETMRAALEAQKEAALSLRIRLPVYIHLWPEYHAFADAFEKGKKSLAAAPATGWVRREEMESLVKDWSDDDDAIKALAISVGVEGDSNDGYFRNRVQVVGDMSGLITDLRAKLSEAEAELSDVKEDLVDALEIKEIRPSAADIQMLTKERDAARAELATLLALCESFHREATGEKP